MIEGGKWSLMGYPSRQLEDNSTESSVYCGGPAQGFQRGTVLPPGLETIAVIVAVIFGGKKTKTVCFQPMS